MTKADIRAAARLALPHRRRRNPFDAPGLDEDLLDQLLGDDEPDPGGAAARAPDRTTRGHRRRADAEDAQAPTAGDPARAERLRRAPNGARPGRGQPEPEPATAQDEPSDRPTSRRRRSRSRPCRSRPRARPTAPGCSPRAASARGGRAPQPGGDDDRPYRSARRCPTASTGPSTSAPPSAPPPRTRRVRGRTPGGRLRLVADDLRHAVTEGRESNLVLLAVDASGSMAARRRMEAVKTAVALAAARRLPAPGQGRAGHVPRERGRPRPAAHLLGRGRRAAARRTCRAAAVRRWPRVCSGRPRRCGSSACATRAAGRCSSWSPTAGPPPDRTRCARSRQAAELLRADGRQRGGHRLRDRPDEPRARPRPRRPPRRRPRPARRGRRRAACVDAVARRERSALRQGTTGGRGLMPEGRVEQAPADGLTTKQRRNRPLLVVHTGDGKGKSTAAFGLAMRGWNQGWSIGVFQFVKSAKWRIGEQTVLETLGELHAQTGQGGPVEWHKMGAGWSWSRKAGHRGRPRRAPPPRAGPRSSAGWPRETHTLYVLDEFTYPMQWGWVDIDDVVATLAERPGPAARDHHRPSRRPPARRGRRPGDRHDPGQAPLRAGPEGSARHRMVSLATALPRLVITAPASGHGKTTVATGLMGALRVRGARGRRLQGRAGLHRPGLPRAGHRPAGPQPRPAPVPARPARPAAAARRRRADAGRRGRGRGRDGAVRRPDGRRRLRLHRARGRADRRPARRGRSTSPGSPGPPPPSCTACTPSNPAYACRGVILNKAGSARLVDEITAALEATGLPVLGVLPRDAGHRGARRATSGWSPRASASRRPRPYGRLAEQVADHLDLQAILAIAHTRTRPRRRAVGPGSRRSTRPRPARPRVAIAARPGLHVPLRRDRGAAARRRLRTGRASTRSSTPRCPRARPGSTSAAASPRCTPPS